MRAARRRILRWAWASRPRWTIANVGGGEYRSADGRCNLQLSFQGFDLYTGLPAQELADDEYGVMVSMSHEWYLD